MKGHAVFYDGSEPIPVWGIGIDVDNGLYAADVVAGSRSLYQGSARTGHFRFGVSTEVDAARFAVLARTCLPVRATLPLWGDAVILVETVEEPGVSRQLSGVPICEKCRRPNVYWYVAGRLFEPTIGTPGGVV